jgi:hypothetical protein
LTLPFLVLSGKFEHCSIEPSRWVICHGEPGKEKKKEKKEPSVP